MIYVLHKEAAIYIICDFLIKRAIFYGLVIFKEETTPPSWMGSGLWGFGGPARTEPPSWCRIKEPIRVKSGPIV